MRIILVFILLTIFSGSELRAMSIEQESPKAQCSQLIAQSNINYDDSVSFYESQIRIADSLYKNYLPQSNFEEVKAAVEFFDSYQPSAISGQRWRFFDSHQPSAISGQRWRLFDKEADDENRLIAESRQLTAAKAHYYHAVGLTEKDDIVGACEHYLIALEIMEPLVETSPQLRLMANDKRQKTKGKGLCDSASLRLCDSDEDYEKIRFVALIYTRLGEIFLNESCCNLAIVNYKNALLFSNVLDDNMFKSNTMKYIGNAYQLYSKQDSALLYYRKSLEYNNCIDNKLDVDKCIAQILYYKGERDSALKMLRNNLNKIDNEIVKYAYHHTLGNMFYKDNAYDSALYYLEESLEDSLIIKKLAFTTTLSAIYDSLGNYEKRAYYDNICSKLLKNNINKEVDKSNLQTLYNNYNERKSESISIEAKARTRRITIISCLGAIIAIMFVFVYVRYNYKKQNDRLKGEINDYAKENKRLIDDFKKSNNKKDKIIKQQKKEISEIKNQFNNATGFNLEAYYDSDICKKILSRKDSDFSSLKEDELALLLKSANLYLNNISVRLREQFPTLNHNDIYTICLIILNVEKNKLPHLLSRDRKTIWDRLDKIRRLMKIDAKQDLFIHIRDNYLH